MQIVDFIPTIKKVTPKQRYSSVQLRWVPLRNMRSHSQYVQIPCNLYNQNENGAVAACTCYFPRDPL